MVAIDVAIMAGVVATALGSLLIISPVVVARPALVLSPGLVAILTLVSRLLFLIGGSGLVLAAIVILGAGDASRHERQDHRSRKHLLHGISKRAGGPAAEVGNPT